MPALQTREFMGERSGRVGVHMTYVTVVIRSDSNPASLVPQARHVVQSFDRALPISQIQTMDEAVGLATA